MVGPDLMIIHINLAMIQRLRSLVLGQKSNYLLVQAQDNTSTNKLMEQSNNALRLGIFKIKLDVKM